MSTLHYKNISVNYTDSGAGSAVIFLHGFLENAAMWESLSAEISKRHRVVTIDLLGHGQTECLGYVHTMEDNADMIFAVLSALKIRKAVFIGHSMGGYVALAFMELYSEKIKGLVLLNSTSKSDNEERKTNRDRAIKAVKQNYTSFVRLSVTNLFSEENRERLSDAIENVKIAALKTPLQGIVASLEGMKIRKDREILLHFATIPVLLVLGVKDQVLNYEENKSQAEHGQIELLTLPYGHMSTIESPLEVQTAILQFLKKIK